jgi:hypothetical protein
MPPSARVAVTVAPLMGTFAAFVTTPTIVPGSILATGAAASAAAMPMSANAAELADVSTPMASK